MTRFIKFWPLGLFLAVSACGLPPIVSAVSYAIEGASYAASGKSMTDHALSAAADRDCAMFRIVKGEEICRDAEFPSEGTALAMVGSTEPGSTLSPAERGDARAPVLYSFGASGATGWQIADGAEVSVTGGAEAVTGPDTLIDPERGISVPEKPASARNAKQVLRIGPGIELFALVQENGTLELFAYDSTQSREQDKLVLVASIEGYAEDPSVFQGISGNDGFIQVEDLIV